MLTAILMFRHKQWGRRRKGSNEFQSNEFLIIIICASGVFRKDGHGNSHPPCPGSGLPPLVVTSAQYSHSAELSSDLFLKLAAPKSPTVSAQKSVFLHSAVHGSLLKRIAKAARLIVWEMFARCVRLSMRFGWLAQTV